MRFESVLTGTSVNCSMCPIACPLIQVIEFLCTFLRKLRELITPYACGRFQVSLPVCACYPGGDKQVFFSKTVSTPANKCL